MKQNFNQPIEKAKGPAAVLFPMLALFSSILHGCSAGQPANPADLEEGSARAAISSDLPAIEAGSTAHQTDAEKAASAVSVLTGEEQGDIAGGCRSTQPLGASLAEIVRNVNHPEELNQDTSGFSDTLLDWVFGGGLGRTALNIGTVVVFPPYAFYMLGNAGIALAGYDPLYVTDALPGPARDGVLGVYNEVTSLPGRINAAVLREHFCAPQNQLQSQRQPAPHLSEESQQLGFGPEPAEER